MTGPGTTAPPAPSSDSTPEAEHRDLFGLNRALIETVLAALDAGDSARVASLVVPLHAADKADLLETVTAEQRASIVEALRPGIEPKVLAELDEPVRDDVVGRLGTDELAVALAKLDTDDAVYLIEDLADDDRRAVLAAVPDAERVALEEGLAYPENSAGRLMQRELVAVPADWTVGETIDYLRSSDDLPEEFYDIFVVGEGRVPVGYVPLSRVMRTRRPVAMSDIMKRDLKPLPTGMDQEEVAFVFHQYGLVSAPVVDGDGRLRGVITVDDVVGVIDEEAEEDIMRLGGVREGDIHEPAWKTARRRFAWLLVNLATAIVASSVIWMFDATIEHMVALAVLMPIVASMGGNAGTQTLTVTVRAIATRELTSANAVRAVAKEGLVGIFNGALFAAVTGAVAVAWFGDPILGAVIAAAMVVNMLVATLCGILVPLGLARVGVDPAVAATVFVTTATDVVGFFGFLGLAALVLM